MRYLTFFILSLTFLYADTRDYLILSLTRQDYQFLIGLTGVLIGFTFLFFTLLIITRK